MNGPQITDLVELLPVLRDARTCREFGALIIAHVPQRLKFTLACAARDALGRTWSDNVVRRWLAPANHAAGSAKGERAACRAAKAKLRSTPEGRERDRVASRTAKAKLRSTPEGLARVRAAQARWMAEGKAAEYSNARYQEDTAFRIRKVLSTRILSALRKTTRDTRKAARTVDLLGCTVAEFKTRLEAQFQLGMTWENHAVEWEIDHIVPVAAFDLTTEDGQRAAFHWSNTMPLWKADNRSKGSLHGGVRHRHQSSFGQ